MTPSLKSTSTKIELSFNKISRMQDLSDLAETLFPGNRNQPHTFIVIWITLRWAEHHIVPNFSEVAGKHEISKRTLERVRARMRRMGLIDPVSRFNAEYGYKEGWPLSAGIFYTYGLGNLCADSQCSCTGRLQLPNTSCDTLTPNALVSLTRLNIPGWTRPRSQRLISC